MVCENNGITTTSPHLMNNNTFFMRREILPLKHSTKNETNNMKSTCPTSTKPLYTQREYIPCTRVGSAMVCIGSTTVRIGFGMVHVGSVSFFYTNMYPKRSPNIFVNGFAFWQNNRLHVSVPYLLAFPNGITTRSPHDFWWALPFLFSQYLFITIMRWHYDNKAVGDLCHI